MSSNIRMATRIVSIRRVASKMIQAAHSGAMVCLPIPPDVASKVVLDGDDAEPVENLHITLFFLGNASELPVDPKIIEETVRGVAAENMPLTGTLGGIGRFAGPPGDDGDPVYLSVDVPGLNEFRDKVGEALKRIGVTWKDNHGYTPHMTLAYIPQNADMPLQRVDAVPLTFGEAGFWMGDKRFNVPLGPSPSRVAKKMNLPLMDHKLTHEWAMAMQKAQDEAIAQGNKAYGDGYNAVVSRAGANFMRSHGFKTHAEYLDDAALKYERKVKRSQRAALTGTVQKWLATYFSGQGPKARLLKLIQYEMASMVEVGTFATTQDLLKAFLLKANTGQLEILDYSGSFSDDLEAFIEHPLTRIYTGGWPLGVWGFFPTLKDGLLSVEMQITGEILSEGETWPDNDPRHDIDSLIARLGGEPQGYGMDWHMKETDKGTAAVYDVKAQWKFKMSDLFETVFKLSGLMEMAERALDTVK